MEEDINLPLLLVRADKAHAREIEASIALTRARTDPTADLDTAREAWAQAYQDLCLVNAELIKHRPEIFEAVS